MPEIEDLAERQRRREKNSRVIYFYAAETPPHPRRLPEGEPHPLPLPEGEGSIYSPFPLERGPGGEVRAGG